MKSNLLLLFVVVALIIICVISGTWLFLQKTGSLSTAELIRTFHPPSSPSQSEVQVLEFDTRKYIEKMAGKWTLKEGESSYEIVLDKDGTYALHEHQVTSQSFKNFNGTFKVEINIVIRGEWKPLSRRCRIIPKSVPVLHIAKILIDAPEILREEGASGIEFVRAQVEKETNNELLDMKKTLLLPYFFDSPNIREGVDGVTINIPGEVHSYTKEK